MKVPDLVQYEDAGVRDWHGSVDPLDAAARTAGAHCHAIDLKGVAGKTDLMHAFQRALALPEHFGENWDALADCLEDDDWMGKNGAIVVLKHAADYKRHHGSDWTMLVDILEEAADYWRERHKAFWTFVA